jgi:hypothetical protein
MKTAPASGFLLSLMVVAAAARADGKAACLDAAGKAQSTRAAHQLLESREQLRICAAAGCPAVIQADCVAWSVEVERLLPGVVVTAKDATGADLIDVVVTVDGQPFLTKLTGQAVATNGGLHTFHLVAPDGSTVERQVLIREGVKDQPVSVVLGASGAAAPGVVGGSTPGASQTAGASSGVASSPLRTVGWVVGGVGAAGLIAGVVAGGVAVSDKASAHCTGDLCQGSLSPAKSAATASTIGLIAGGVLLAGGAGLVIFGPSRRSEPTTGIRVLPAFTANGGVLMAGGSF